MATDRDDFIIAVRSAFLKKGTQQKFSLFVLILISSILLSLETLEIKPLKPIRSMFRDFVYRSSFIFSIPGKTISSGFEMVRIHFEFYSEYQQLRLENDSLKQTENKIGFLESENRELKKLLEQNTNLNTKQVISKVLIDRQSPYLKSVIINRGSDSNLKKGMAVLSGAYMIGRITEVNYLSSRVLLINDLNSKIPVIIEPDSIQAIMTGSGENFGEIGFLREGLTIKQNSIVYTSGAAGVFKAGIPIGKIKKKNEDLIVDYFIDLTQLKIARIIVNDQ